MTEEELKSLKKQASKGKRIASEWAAQLHDLVEDRLPAAYRELPEISQATYAACEAWERAEQAYREAEASVAEQE